jgi:hypothetical protein
VQNRAEATRAIIRYRTTIFISNRWSHIDMSFRETLSRAKKVIKRPFKRNRRNQDGERIGTGEGRPNSEEPLSRAESPFVGGSDRDLERSGPGTVGEQVRSTDRPARQDGSEPVPPPESKTNEEGEGENDAIENTIGNLQHSYPPPGVETVAETGHGGKVDQALSDTTIPDNVQSDGV